MKRSLAFSLSLLLTLLSVLILSSQNASAAESLAPRVQSTPVGPSLPEETEPPVEGAVHGLYFYANDCSHCIVTLEEVIEPMKAEMGPYLDLRLLEIGLPEYYEALLAVELKYDITGSDRGLPTLVLGDIVLVGETEVRESFPDLVAAALEAGGVPFPEIPGVDPESLVSVAPEPEDEESCSTDSGDSCVVEAPIYVAYFYQTGCNECSRVDADLAYLQTQYPQMQVMEFNIYDHADLAVWMVDQVGFEGDFQTPALIIGEDVLIGEEIVPGNIAPVLDQYTETGTEPIWLSFDPESGQQNLIDRFKEMGWLAVVAAGLIDGINPCAFATLIFFVSYLTLSGRKGKEVLFVGGAFTLGVFLAYLAVGLGLYQILELVGETLDVIARIVYAVTGIFCLVLAVLSFLDFRKARKGNIEDMMLKLPEPLRKRINATIRKGRNAASYVLGAFLAGVMISFLELACTGQVYLPTIIFVSSIPELRIQALLYLVIYNLLFVLPLIIIFILVYFGTTSKDLTQFLKKNAAIVKLGMAVVFIALGGWLLFSIFS
jgi:cytochrome c biogenesis protein CcdA